MDDSNVAIRLKGFIDSRGLSHSQFADECGIPRPSLSQILSGRNKKISDVIVGQIHKAFPSLSILWLLFNEGSMIVGSSDSLADNTDTETGHVGLSESLNRDSSSGGSVQIGADSVDEFSEMFNDSDSLFSFVNDDMASHCSQDATSVSKGGVLGASGAKNTDVVSKSVDGQSNEGLQANLRALKLRLGLLKHTENELVECKNKISDLESQIENLRMSPRKVSHITVYYDDSTFETFITQQQ